MSNFQDVFKAEAHSQAPKGGARKLRTRTCQPLFMDNGRASTCFGKHELHRSRQHFGRTHLLVLMSRAVRRSY